MKSPYSNKEMQLVLRKNDTEIYSETINFTALYFYCELSDEYFESPSLMDKNILQVKNTYRNKHSIPFPEDLEIFRNAIGLSSSKLSNLFGFGVNQWNQYEKGSIPNKSNSKLLKSIQNKSMFKSVVLDLGINEIEKQAILEKYSTFLESVKKNNTLNATYEKYLPTDPLEYGYRKLSILKASNIFNKIASIIRKGKVAINKIYYFIEKEYFRKYGVSITGIPFQAIQMGPVPIRYDLLFGRAQGDGYIEWIEYDDNRAYYQGGDCEFNELYFTKSEIEIINRVINNYQEKSREELKQLSHEDDGWKENEKEQKIINYLYSYYKDEKHA